MRHLKGFAIGLAAAAALLAVGYAELVLDIRLPRSSLVENHAIGTNVSARIDNFDAVAEKLRQKFGPNAKTTIQSPNLRWVTEVDGKVVQETPVAVTFGGVLGVFVVGARDRYASIFPFQLDPEELPPPRRYSAIMVKDRFKNGFPARFLDYDDRHVVQGSCVVVEPADLGKIGVLLRLNAGTFCVVIWKGAGPAAMLIGAALANGDPWMWPFTERICRSLTAVALGKVAKLDQSPPPEFAACILIDRPERRGGASENLQAHVYEVSRAGKLALIDPPAPRASSPAPSSSRP